MLRFAQHDSSKTSQLEKEDFGRSAAGRTEGRFYQYAAQGDNQQIIILGYAFFGKKIVNAVVLV